MQHGTVCGGIPAQDHPVLSHVLYSPLMGWRMRRPREKGVGP